MKTNIFCSLCFLALLGLSVPADAARFLVDFSRDNVDDGNQTSNPDLNGNYWNNMADSGNFTITTGSGVTDLVDTSNGASSIDLVTTSTLLANGIRNGGLLAPSAGLLGDFAVPTATQDYYFVDAATGFSGTMELRDLDPTATYDFRLFATRSSTNGPRTTEYTFTGANSDTVQLTTTAIGIGSGAHPDGNDSTIVSVNGIVPNGSNAIELQLESITNNWGYIGILEITENPVPEPAAGLLLALGGVIATMIRRRV